jgi:hypothetical protein
MEQTGQQQAVWTWAKVEDLIQKLPYRRGDQQQVLAKLRPVENEWSELLSGNTTQVLNNLGCRFGKLMLTCCCKPNPVCGL